MSEETTCVYYVRRREFLNEDPDLPAFIIGIVEDTRAIADENHEHWASGYVALDFADCYRRVCFNFDMHNPCERANSLRKINLIAEVVNAVREGIALEVESRNARPVPEPAKVEEEPAKVECDQKISEAAPAQTEVEPAIAEIGLERVNKTTAHFFTSYITRLGL